MHGTEQSFPGCDELVDAVVQVALAAVGDHGQGLAEWSRHAWAEIERGPWDRGAAIDVAVTAAWGRALALPDEQAEELLAFATAVIGDVEPEKMEGVTLGQTLVVVYAEALAMSLEPAAVSE